MQAGIMQRASPHGHSGTMAARAAPQRFRFFLRTAAVATTTIAPLPIDVDEMTGQAAEAITRAAAEVGPLAAGVTQDWVVEPLTRLARAALHCKVVHTPSTHAAAWSASFLLLLGTDKHRQAAVADRLRHAVQTLCF